MKIGIFGGSFNPPHLGHSLASQFVLATEAMDELWWVPCFEHPFGKENIDFDHRVQMCKLAISVFDSARVKVSVVERELGTKSRTYDTLSHLASANKGVHFSLVIGSDLLAEKDAWYRFDDIEKEFGVIAVPRGQRDGHPFAIPDISSHQIREQVGQSNPVSGLLDRRVAEYIDQHKLYRPT